MTGNVRHQQAADELHAESQARGAVVSHARLILAVVIAAAFLDVVDFSVVQVALPTIQREFLAPLAESQWVTGVYGLTLAGFLMVSGRAGDVYGQKRLFLIGIVLFTVSSLSAGLAPSLLSLVVSRAIQGIAAAMTTATALAILAATFPEGKERNRAFGVLVSILSAGFAAGSIAGGLLTAAFLLGNVAIRTGKPFNFDGEKCVADVKEAAPLIRRTYRKGWDLIGYNG